MPVKTNTKKEITCRCKTVTIVDFKPATAYCELTKFVCDCGRIYHIMDYHNGITTYREVTIKEDSEYLASEEEHKNRNRVRCSYPMSEFYTFKDEVPTNVRVSTPEDCEKCEGMNGCEDSKHCLFEESKHCLQKLHTPEEMVEIL